MAMSKTAKQLAATLAIGLTLRFVLTKAGWHPPSLAGNRILPALVLWVIFGIYWGIAGLNSAPTENSESRLSTYFHQFLLGVAMLLVILPVPGLNGWFLPPDSLMIIAAGRIVQRDSCCWRFGRECIWDATGARRSASRWIINWSAAARTGCCVIPSTRRCWACSWERRSP